MPIYGHCLLVLFFALISNVESHSKKKRMGTTISDEMVIDI